MVWDIMNGMGSSRQVVALQDKIICMISSVNRGGQCLNMQCRNGVELEDWWILQINLSKKVMRPSAVRVDGERGSGGLKTEEKL